MHLRGQRLQGHFGMISRTKSFEQVKSIHTKKLVIVASAVILLSSNYWCHKKLVRQTFMIVQNWIITKAKTFCSRNQKLHSHFHKRSLLKEKSTFSMVHFLSDSALPMKLNSVGNVLMYVANIFSERLNHLKKGENGISGFPFLHLHINLTP